MFSIQTRGFELIWAEEFGDKKLKLRYFLYLRRRYALVWAEIPWEKDMIVHILSAQSHLFIPGKADARGIVRYFGFLVDWAMLIGTFILYWLNV